MLKSILLSALVVFISLGAFADYSVTLISTPGGVGALSPAAGNTYTLTPAQNPFHVSVVSENTPYVFSHWEIGGVPIGYLHELSWTITGDTTITAVFVEGYHLTVLPPTGAGSISPEPGLYGYAANTLVLVTAAPDACNQVKAWTGTDNDGSTATTNTVTMTSDKTVAVEFELIPFTLLYVAGANGSITGVSPQTVNCGADGAAVTAVPAPGYHFVQWSDVLTQDPRADTNVTAAISVTASFAVGGYTLTYAAGANGSITGASPQTVDFGTDGAAVTAAPVPGYHFVQWSDASTENPRTDTDVTANISVTASFAIDTFTLTYTAGANGSITGASPQTVDFGTDGAAVTAVASAHYHFVNWSDASTQNPRSDTNVTANISVTASFAIDTFTLTYTAGANGSITGASPQTVGFGTAGAAVTAVAGAHYHFVNWSDASTQNPRTDTNVTAAISATASFAIDTFTLTYTAGANGAISGTTPQTIIYGNSGTLVTAVPATGYHFVQWSDASTQNPRADTNVTANISVTANFTIYTYTLTYTAGADGSILGASPQTVNYGAGGAGVLAVPATGYHFVQWSDASTRNPRADTNVTANVSVTADFGVGGYTLTYTAGANGSILGTSPQTVDFGGDGTAVTAVADAHYHFVNWSDASTQNPRTDTTVVVAITVTANFAIDTLTLTYGTDGHGSISGTNPQTVGYDMSGTPVTAVPAGGYQFAQWSDASTQNPRTDTNVTADMSVTATFAQREGILSMALGSGSYSTLATDPVTGTIDLTLINELRPTFAHVVVAGFRNPATGAFWTGTTPEVILDTVPAPGPDGQAYSAVAIVLQSPAVDVAQSFDLWLYDAVMDPADGKATNEAAAIEDFKTVTSTANDAYNVKVIRLPVFPSYQLDTSVTAGLGTIAPPSGLQARGNTVTLTASPETGYRVEKWSGTDNDASAGTTNSVTMTGPKTVSVSFANTFTLTATVTGNVGGTVSSASYVYVYGNTATLTATPDACYRVASWSGVDSANGNTATVIMTSNKSVTVTFELIPYTVTYAADVNGTILGTSPQTVNCGMNSVAVTAAPDTGYHFVQWSDASTQNPRTDTNVTGNIIVTASFAIDAFTLTYAAGANGSIVGTSPQMVNYGADGAAVTAIASVRYHFVNWSDASTQNPRTDTNVTGNITVTASFATDTFTLTYAAGANGSIAGTNPQTVNYGADGAAVTAVANVGYKFIQWSDASTQNPRTETGVTANVSVTAAFAGEGIVSASVLSGLTAALAGDPVSGELDITLVNEIRPTFTHVLVAGFRDPTTGVFITGTTPVVIQDTIVPSPGARRYAPVATALPTVAVSTPQTYVVSLYDAVKDPADGTATNEAGAIEEFEAATVISDDFYNVNLGDVTVYPSYELDTSVAAGSGTIDPPSGPQVRGNTVTLTATPLLGYYVQKWSGTDNDASTATTNAVTMTGPKSVSVSFANSYTLTASVIGDHGTVSPTFAVYAYANTATLTAEPDPCYQVKQWTGTDNDASTATTNVVTMLSDKTVTVEFELSRYTLTYTAGANGAILGTSLQTVNCGSDGTAVTAAPDMGYYFVQWSDASTQNPRTDMNVTGNISVTASFAISPNYTLTYMAGANGSITGASPQTVAYGASGTAVTAVPNSGYYFVQWSDNLTQNPRTDTNVTGNVSVTASFALNPTRTLTYTAGANGSISGTTPQTVAYGASGTAVTAVPNTHYHFVSWSDASTQNPRTDTLVTANISVTANFALNTTYTLTTVVTPVGQGTVDLTPTGGVYDSGTVVTLNAVAAASSTYAFANWSGDTTGITGNVMDLSIQVTMTANKTLTANFVPGYTLTTSVTPTGKGTIDIEPPDTRQPPEYAPGRVVTLNAIAVANSHYVFDHWSGDTAGITGNITAPSIGVTMTANKNLTANFVPSTVSLTINYSPSTPSPGTVAANPSPGPYAYGATVQMTATANTGYVFDHWEWDGLSQGTSPVTTIQLTKDETVTAVFALLYTLTTANLPANGGTTVATPPGASYKSGTIVAVTARPNAGYSFDHWSGDTGTADVTKATISITMDGNKSLTANYTAKTFTLTYAAGSNGSISGASSQTVSYGQSGSAVTAAPSQTYGFVQWSDGSKQNPRTDANVTANVSVTATFTLITYTLTATVSPTNGGHVNLSAPGPYVTGSQVTLTAVANNGFNFDHWSGDVAVADQKTSPIVLTMNSNKTVTAVFAPVLCALTINYLPSNAAGTVSAWPPQSPYTFDTHVQLTAASNAGFAFDHWEWDGASQSTNFTTSIQMTGDKTVTAVFGYAIAINNPPATGGTTTVTLISGSQSGTGTAYTSGSVISIQATPSVGYNFDHWSGTAAFVTPDPAKPWSVTVDVNAAGMSLTPVFVHQTHTLTYTAGPGGSILGTTPQTVNYGASAAAVTAVANTGYHFVNWSDLTTANPRTDTNVTADVTVTANFVLNTYSLTYTAGPGGSISGATPQTVNYGASGAVVTAVANTGYHFVNWSDLTTANPRADANVTANVTVTANFVLNTYTLAYAAGPGGLILGATPQRVNYGASGAAVTAVASAGYYFVHWSDLSTANPRMDANVAADVTVTALFTNQAFSVALNVTPPNAGSVQADRPGPYGSGSTVTLTAQANAGFVFDHWTGDLTGVTNPGALMVDANKTVTAVFVVGPHAVTTSVSPSGAGAVSINPPTGPYPHNSTVTVTATPAAGYFFSYWGGDVSGSANPATFTVDSDKNVIANFTTKTYSLTMNVLPTSAVGAITTDRPAPYAAGQIVTLTATANAGYVFDYWVGGVTGTANPAQLTMNNNSTVTAVFQVAYPLSVSVTPVGSGTITPVPDAPYYAPGSKVQLTATANAGYGFVAWSGDIAGATILGNTLTLTMDSAKAVMAAFSSFTHPLNAIVSPAGAGTVSTIPAQGPFADGTSVTISATAKSGFLFDHWEGDLTGTANPASVLMNGTKNVTAVFVPQTYAVALNVSPAGAGTVSTVPAQGSFAPGATVAVTASANAGYVFSYWTGDLSGTTNPGQLTMTGNKSVTAIFTPATFNLTTNITPAGGGTVTVGSSGPYLYGTMVQLTAQANAGFNFIGWQGDATGTALSVAVLMNANKSVTAVFQKQSFLVTTLIAPIGAGNITLNPPSASGSYDYGTSVTLTATPATGYQFDHWSGLTASTNPVTIVVSSSQTIVANFTAPTYTLAVASSPAGGGSVAKNPDNGQQPYAYGTQVTLTPNPSPGYVFAHWTGSLQGSNSPAVIMMDGNKQVTAIFNKAAYTVAVAWNPQGGGSVTVSPSQATYYWGDTVILSALPNATYTFAKWAEDGITDNPRTLTVTGNVSLTANFAIETFKLTAQATTGGSVALNPPNGPYPIGSQVTLTATPDLYYVFDQWEGDLTGSINPNTLTMTADKTVTAVFSKPTYTLALAASPAGGGTVAPTPQQASYQAGDALTLLATPAPGYVFSAWSGGLSGSTNPASIVMDANKTITAVFVQVAFNITMNVAPPGAGSIQPDTPGPYTPGLTVNLTASPNAGYAFDHWTGDLTGNANPSALVMNANKNVTAVFVQKATLGVTIFPVNAGSVATDTSGPYNLGTTVKLTATANTGYVFNHWEGDLTGNVNPSSLTMNANKNVTAVFYVALNAVVSPVGAGTIAPATGAFAVNSVVTLTATPSSQYLFRSWTGDLAGSTTNPVTLTMNTYKNVTAVFTLKTYNVTLSVSPSNAGSIQPDAAGPYASGSSVKLTAQPNTGYAFDHWGGDLAGNANPASLVMTKDSTVTAVFVLAPQALTWNVSPAAAGMVTTNPATGPFPHNSTVTLTASPAPGYFFSYWGGAVSGSTNPATLTMDTDKTVTAYFTQITRNLVVNTSPPNIGKVTTDRPGPYADNSIVTLTASGTSTYTFDHWLGDLTGTANPAQITMAGGDKTVTAVFTANNPNATYSLQLSVTPFGGGTVLPNPAPDPSTNQYKTGTVVVLMPFASAGYKFDHWTGDPVAADGSITMDSAKSVMAVFAANTYKLTYTAGPNGSISGTASQTVGYLGSGTLVTAAPNAHCHFVRWSDGSTTNPRLDVNVNADITVTASFAADLFTLTYTAATGGAISGTTPQTVGYGASGAAVTAVANANYQFVNWSDLSTANPRSDMNVTASVTVTATFVKPTYTLTLTASPQNGGSISSNPQQTTYQSGNTATLTANAASGYAFTGWSGDLTGTANPASITMNANKNVTATFTKTWALTTVIQPAGAGTIALNPAQGPYLTGSVVTLTPTPAPGYAFSYWSGDLTGTGPAQLTMNADKNITAIFTQQQYTLTTAASPVIGGSVSASPNGPYVYGAQVTLTATPQPGYVFQTWQGDATGSSASVVVTMTGNKSVTALFSQAGYVLTVALSPQGGGTVTADPSTGPYAPGASVTLTPNPSSGYLFDHWEGDAQGNTTPLTLVMNANKSVTAVFLTSSCTLSVFTETYPADGSTLYVGQGAAAASLVVTAGTDCPDDTASVEFQLGSLETNVSTPDSEHVYSAVAGTLGDLGFGSHTLTISATGKYHTNVTIQATVTFTIAQAGAATDTDGNGLPDQVFTALNPGDSWYAVIVDPVTGAQRISVVTRWDRTGKADDGANAPSVSLQDPEDPAASITVTASPDLLTAGQSAALIVRAAPDLDTLYGAAGASVFGADPGALAPDGKYMDIAVATSMDGGKDYGEIAAAQVAANPLHVTISGLQFATGATPSLYSHPSQIQNNTSTGLDIVPLEGNWTTTGVAGLVRGGTVIDADLASLSTFAVFDTSVGAAEINVTPASYTFNSVQIGSSQTTAFVLKNTADAGSGHLIGEASISGAAAFTMEGEPGYDLAPGESKTITVQFTPTSTQQVTGSIAFTGGGGVNVSLSGTGSNASPLSCLGLGIENTPTGGLGAARGDLLLLVLASMALALAGRKTARKRARIL